MRQNVGSLLVGLVLFVIGAGLGVVAVTQGWFGSRGAAEQSAESPKKSPASELEGFLNLLAKAKDGDLAKKLPGTAPQDQTPGPADKLKPVAPIKKVAVLPFVIGQKEFKADEKDRTECKAEAKSFLKNLRKLLAANVGLTIIEVAETEAPKEKKDFLEFGEKLGVDAILSGQMDFRYTNPDSVSASLYQIKTATYLWSKKFDWNSFQGLSDLENFHQIPGLIAQELKQKLPVNK
jgi:TolB-like protein